MLAINFIIACLSLWLIMLINYHFLQPALKNQQRFKLYKLRDELSLLAMRGELDENSDEYLTLIKLINNAIRATGSFQVTDYLKFIFNFHKDEERKARFKSIIEKIDQADHKEYCRIASDVFEVLHDILRSDTRALRYFLLPGLLAVGFLLKIVKITKLIEKVEKKQEQINEMDEDLDDYKDQFGKKTCAA